MARSADCVAGSSTRACACRGPSSDRRGRDGGPCGGDAHVPEGMERFARCLPLGRDWGTWRDEVHAALVHTGEGRVVCARVSWWAEYECTEVKSEWMRSIGASGRSGCENRVGKRHGRVWTRAERGCSLNEAMTASCALLGVITTYSASRQDRKPP
ncbi:hypothetical protein WOLCODRAFT_162246 [Wolfiporia cocos MD-104 SS10]|uniref:Uncharacterized protein n=1 Tax=Wolfiporia cocos (strain MD-104) TaxID=742152 RepID=A0A2H3JFG5_WOLCO|nr:hypothetical protein WOLCODRAFT_162246 [Wolfiporia cocos MD-104 SS10]